MNFKQWNRIDRAIFTTAAVLLLLFSYFLYDDSLLFRNNGDSTAEKVGEFVKTENDVRQKNKDSFSWAPASKKQDVRHLDSVFTGENSEAQIKLTDGTVIRLKPNSLVTINMKQGQMQLDLKYGDLVGEVSQNSQVQVRVNGEDVALKSAAGSSIQIRKEKTGNTDLQVLKGQASLATKDGEKKIKEAKPPRLITTDLKVTKINSAEAFEVPWKAEGEPSSFEVVIAEDNTFQNVLFKKQTDRTKVQAQGAFPTGHYAWKVIALKADGSHWGESAPRVLDINVAQVPQWITPDKDGAINKRFKKGSPKPLQISLPLVWTSQGTPEYEIEVAATPDFAEVLQAFKSNQSQIESPQFQNGSYYLRVRARKNEKLVTDWSNTRRLDVTLAEVQLDPPRLVKKVVEFEAPKANERRPASESTPQMAWHNVPDANQYSVQLSTSPDFSTGMEKQVSGRNFNWEKYKAGKYFFRVFAKTEDGLQSPPSETGVLNVNVGFPVIQPVPPIMVSQKNPNIPPEPQSVDVKWTSVATADGYEVEVATAPDFSDAKKFTTRSPASTLNVPAPGKYHVRVRGTEQGRSISSFSPVEDIVYSFRKQLEAPLLVAPFSEMTLFLQKLTTPFVRFEWKAVKDAAKYEFQMSNLPDFSQVFMKAQSSSPRISVQQKLPPGQVFWRVRAIGPEKDQSSDWSQPRLIQVEKSDSKLFIE